MGKDYYRYGGPVYPENVKWRETLSIVQKLNHDDPTDTRTWTQVAKI